MDATCVYALNSPSIICGKAGPQFDVPGLYTWADKDETANYLEPHEYNNDFALFTTHPTFRVQEREFYVGQHNLSCLPLPTIPATSVTERNNRPQSKLLIADRVRTADTGRTPLFHCTICNRGFAQRKSLVRHNRSVHGDAIALGQLRCDTCGLSFKRKDIRDRHIKYQHGTTKIECMVCGVEVSERAITSHWQSASCKAMQAMSDRRHLAEISKACRVDTSGKFGVEVVADIWVLAANLYVYWAHIDEYKGDGFDLHHFLQLEGFVMRALSKLLPDCPRTERAAAAAAILILDKVENGPRKRSFTWFTPGENYKLCLSVPPLSRSGQGNLLTAVTDGGHDPDPILQDMSSDEERGGRCVFRLHGPRPGMPTGGFVVYWSRSLELLKDSLEEHEWVWNKRGRLGEDLSNGSVARPPAFSHSYSLDLDPRPPTSDV